jgi:hypothetical protein
VPSNSTASDPTPVEVPSNSPMNDPSLAPSVCFEPVLHPAPSA